jgi:hypothetical protein
VGRPLSCTREQTNSLTGGRVFPVERRVSLEQVEADSPFHPWRPEDPLASDTSVASAWENGWFLGYREPSAVALLYRSGIRIYEHQSGRPHPVAQFKSLRKWDGIPGRIERIHGSPAFVVPPDCHGPGFVEVVVDGVDVEIDGRYGVTAEQLVSLARSLR